MNFFDHQEAARKKTGRLVLLFALAVAGLVGLTCLIVFFALGGQGDWSVFAVATGGVLAIVGLSAAFKIATLRGGGHSVASMMNGRLIEPGSRDPLERRALNVVEEIAIASGVPTPPVYVLDEEKAINAFAAGYSVSDAVIGLSRGCVEKLSRDELQGVVAHEFSHILNGDMRLNIRLIGIVFGIIVIGLIGRHVLRAAAYSRHGYHRRGKDGGGAVAILLVAVGLVVLGSVGTFFGNWIKAAVSRQREYLADASAVQFTRNPNGITGALKKIGGYRRGSRLENPHTSEISHLLFSQGLGGMFSSIFATHPPLVERIRRLDPSFEGELAQMPDLDEAATVNEQTGAFAAGASPAAAASALESVGQPNESHVHYARELVAALPEAIRSSAHEPYGARAVIFALLIQREESARERQLRELKSQVNDTLFAETLALNRVTEGLDPKARIPLVDMTVPALRELSPWQYSAFRRVVIGLIEADGRLELFEWTLSRIVLHHLDACFDNKRKPAPTYYALTLLGRPCSTLLSALVHAGREDAKQLSVEEARRAFDAGASRLQANGLELQPAEAAGLRSLGHALKILRKTAPRCKRAILEACAATISADKQVTVSEGELFRGIADSLDCPMPPLLPGQPLF